MLIRPFFAVALLATLAACSVPERRSTPPDRMPDFRTNYGNLVLGGDPGSGAFEVFARAGDTEKHLWCAAGDYATRALGLRGNTRLYVARPLGRSDRPGRARSVIFTALPTDDMLKADEVYAQDYARTVSRVGESRQTAAARFLCDTVKRFLILGPYER